MLECLSVSWCCLCERCEFSSEYVDALLRQRDVCSTAVLVSHVWSLVTSPSGRSDALVTSCCSPRYVYDVFCSSHALGYCVSVLCRRAVHKLWHALFASDYLQCIWNDRWMSWPVSVTYCRGVFYCSIGGGQTFTCVDLVWYCLYVLVDKHFMQ